MKRSAAALVLTLLGPLAEAAPIYRCGQTYSQAPCPGGRLIDAADPRSAAQRAEARRAMAKQRQLAAQLERERIDRDASTPAAQATGFDARAPAPAPAASRPAKGKQSSKAKPLPTGDFTAVAPAKPKKAAN